MINLIEPDTIIDIEMLLARKLAKRDIQYRRRRIAEIIEKIGALERQREILLKEIDEIRRERK